jgi:6-phosphogluconolactonase
MSQENLLSPRTHPSAAALVLLAPLAALAFAGTASASDGHFGDHQHGHGARTVYTETNAVTGNEVLAFQNVDGIPTAIGSYPTSGLGSGTGLGSQGAVVADDDHLLAVNAGSNQVSLFDIERDGSLTLDDIESSGGVNPISITMNDNVAYVVNAGDGTVSGFRIRHDRLEPIEGSTQSLPGSGAAQISFDATGRRLVVTEKNTNSIDVLVVDRHGVAGAATSNPSTGQTPFGFAIDDRNHVIVSNAAGGGAGASSVSSYRFAGRASLESVSPAVADTQSAACWIALSENQKYAYTTNAGSGSISSYRVGRDGSLRLLQAVAASPGTGPNDMVEVDGFLVTLNTGSHTISVDTISADGSLAHTIEVTVPAGVVGLASS